MPRQVSYTFLLSDKFSAAAKRIAAKTDLIRKKFKRLGPAATKASLSVGRGFKRMGRSAKGAFTTGIAPLLAGVASLGAAFKFINIGTQFQDALADLSAITNTTGQALVDMRSDALRLAKDSRTSAAQVATAFKIVGSGKSDLLLIPGAVTQVTEQVLLLKNATGVDLTRAANIALDSLNQFGAGADQASRFVNVLAAGAKVGASEVGQISEAMKNAGPVAKALNLSFELTNASLQVLAKGGKKGAEAGTGLRGVMLKLNKVIPFDQVGGFANALEILAKKGLTVAQLQTKVFGEESITAGTILLENIPLIRQWTKEVTGTNAATEQANIRLRTLTAKFRGVKTAIENALIRTFDRVAPQLDNMVVKMEAFFDSIKKEDIDVFAKRIGVLLNALGTVGKLLGLFTKLGPLLNVALAPLRVLIFSLEKLLALPENVAILAAQLTTGRSLAVAGPAPAFNPVFGKIDATITVKSPKGAVESAKVKASGSGLKAGINMEEEL